MSTDLAVETATIRWAADVLDEASEAYEGGVACRVFHCPLGDASLGHSAVAREVVAGALRRVDQALEAARQLARLSSAGAAALRTAAAAFDAAESSLAPPR